MWCHLILIYFKTLLTMLKKVEKNNNKKSLNSIYFMRNAIVLREGVNSDITYIYIALKILNWWGWLFLDSFITYRRDYIQLTNKETQESKSSQSMIESLITVSGVYYTFFWYIDSNEIWT